MPSSQLPDTACSSLLAPPAVTKEAVGITAALFRRQRLLLLRSSLLLLAQPVQEFGGSVVVRAGPEPLAAVRELAPLQTSGTPSASSFSNGRTQFRVEN